LPGCSDGVQVVGLLGAVDHAEEEAGRIGQPCDPDTVTMPLAPVAGKPQQYARVIKMEEKGSDVNLATHLLHDAHMGRFDVAVVISNDSDLLAPIRIVREQLDKKVGILNPQKNPSRALLPHFNLIKQIRAGSFRRHSSLTPSRHLSSLLSGKRGSLHRELQWALAFERRICTSIPVMRMRHSHI